jgi:ornithine cyclodeaminase
MIKIINLEQIKNIVNSIDPVKEIEEGFVLYTQGKVVVPPVGEMIFENPPGDCHIKYGYIKGDEYFVVKIASGFYDNPKLGLPGYSGLMLLFSQKTGKLISILLDEGHLTNVRTAAAGAVCAKYLAPRRVKRIGIVGSGVQARMQLKILKSIIDCKDVLVWGRTQQNLNKYKKDMKSQGYNVDTTLNIEEIPLHCNLIITCTPSKVPLLYSNQIRKGTHITAVGSDTSGKQELDANILKMADHVIVDSIAQSQSRGECSRALKDGIIDKDKIVELGDMIMNKKYQRISDNEITIADLTGVAVQDIQIAKAIYFGLKS